MRPRYPVLEAELAKAGFTKKSVAEMLGITARTMSSKLTGKHKFSKAERMAISNLLNSDESHLFDAQCEMHPSVSTPECISIPVSIGGELIETITVPKQ